MTARNARGLRALWAALAVAVMALAACSGDSGVDEVTVSAGEASVTVPAAASCLAPKNATQMKCAAGDGDDDAPHLAVAPGTPLQGAVPQRVADTPWVIVFAYTDAAGEAQGDRTAVFAPGERSTYRLVPPEGAQLNRVEVQTLTAAPIKGGGVEFPATATWVLIIDPATGSATP